MSYAEHGINLLTASASLDDARQESYSQIMSMLADKRFLKECKSRALRDFITDEIRLDSFDELMEMHNPDMGFSSRYMIMMRSMLTQTFYTNNAFIVSSAAIRPKAANDPNFGEQGLRRGNMTTSYFSDIAQMSFWFLHGLRQDISPEICPGYNYRYDFVTINVEVDSKEKGVEKYMKKIVMPVIVIDHRDSAELRQLGLADEFSNIVSKLVKLTSHDFPIHAATDQEMSFIRNGELWHLIYDCLHQSPSAVMQYSGYEDYSYILGLNLFYISENYGFKEELIAAMDDMFDLTDKILKAGCPELAARLENGLLASLLSNYVEMDDLLSRPHSQWKDVIESSYLQECSRKLPMMYENIERNFSVEKITELLYKRTKEEAESRLTSKEKKLMGEFLLKFRGTSEDKAGYIER